MQIQRFAAFTFASALFAVVILQSSNAAAAVEGDAFLVTRSQIFHAEPSGQSTEVSAESMITVLGQQMDERGNLVVHLGVDSDVSGAVSEFWVRASELETANLQALDQGVDVDQVEGQMSAFIQKKMTYCYRFVKLYLMKKGLVRGYLPGGSAWMAKNYLPSHGFRRLAGGPTAARLNDVCVYTGGNGNNGHIEVRTSSGWYYGYGNKSRPISLNNHRLIACYRKG